MPDDSVYARIHPDDWKQLDDRFDSVKVYADVRVRAVEGRTEALEGKVDGNGRPGILDRLARLETQVKIAATVVGGALTVIGGAVLTFILGQPPKPPTP